MALSKEALEVLKALGVEEGKTLAETIAEASTTTTNEILNAYDKRQEKKFKGILPEGFSDTMAEIQERLKKPEPEPKKGEKGEPSEAETELATANKKLLERLEKIEKTAAEQLKTNEKLQGEQRTTAMNKAITDAATGEKSGLDAGRIQFLLPWLAEKGMVRAIEGQDGAFEMDIQTPDPIDGSRQFKPLTDAMEIFAKTDTGKGFRPPRSTKSGEHHDDKAGQFDGDSVTLESLGGDAKKIREMSEKVKITN